MYPLTLARQDDSSRDMPLINSQKCNFLTSVDPFVKFSIITIDEFTIYTVKRLFQSTVPMVPSLSIVSSFLFKIFRPPNSIFQLKWPKLPKSSPVQRHTRSPKPLTVLFYHFSALFRKLQIDHKILIRNVLQCYSGIYSNAVRKFLSRF